VVGPCRQSDGNKPVGLIEELKETFRELYVHMIYPLLIASVFHSKTILQYNTVQVQVRVGLMPSIILFHGSYRLLRNSVLIKKAIPITDRGGL
jgi:hypothetical protein